MPIQFSQPGLERGPISSRSLASMIRKTSAAGISTTARRFAFSVIDSKGAPGMRTTAGGDDGDAEVAAIATGASASLPQAVGNLESPAEEKKVAPAEMWDDGESACLDQAEREDRSARGADERLECLKPVPAAPAGRRCDGRKGRRRRPGRCSQAFCQRTCRGRHRSEPGAYPAASMPLSTTGVCPKNTIEGSRWAPMLEEEDEQEQLQRAAGRGDQAAKAWASAAGTGPTHHRHLTTNSTLRSDKPRASLLDCQQPLCGVMVKR